jgi:hypothetical protein
MTNHVQFGRQYTLFLHEGGKILSNIQVETFKKFGSSQKLLVNIQKLCGYGSIFWQPEIQILCLNHYGCKT